MTRAADQGTGQGTPQAWRRRDPAKMAGKDEPRTVLSGGGEELVELAKTNLRELEVE